MTAFSARCKSYQDAVVLVLMLVVLTPILIFATITIVGSALIQAHMMKWEKMRKRRARII